MKICYLGPVERQPLLQSWCSPGVVLEARLPGGPAAINNLRDEYASVLPAIETVLQAQKEGFSAVILGCFGDPGLDALREVADIPVVGIGEASLLVAMMMGQRPGVVTPLPGLVGPTWRQIRALGIEGRVAGVVPLGLSVEEIRQQPERAAGALKEAGLRLIERHGADVVVPGCGSLALYAEKVGAELPVPVLNPLRVGVRMAELMAGLGAWPKRAAGVACVP